MRLLIKKSTSKNLFDSALFKAQTGGSFRGTAWAARCGTGQMVEAGRDGATPLPLIALSPC
jgi:hypothetical protein